MAATVTIDYAPRAHFLPLHNSGKRWICAVAHRRAGKTVACINHLIRGAISTDKQDARFAYVAPTYGQAKDVAWLYLTRFTAALLPYGAVHQVSELYVTLPNGSRIRLYGADNYDRLRGGYLDGVVIDEMGDIDPRAWSEVIRPALADRLGWAIFIGTPKGQNGFYRIYQQSVTDPDWLSLTLKASETGYLPQSELDDARKGMTEDQYDQEFECSFTAAIQGAYYARELDRAETDKRIGTVPHDSRLPVITAWDLGVGDSTAIWMAQQVGREVRLIDYLEHAGVGLDWYVKELDKRPYRYGLHILPHDVEVRELGTGRTRLEVLRKLGINNTRIIAAQSVDDGINAARVLIGRTWFDREHCQRGLECLRNYRADWDAKKQVYATKPLHDWSSHAADAFRYLALGIPEDDKKPKPIKYNDGWVV